MGKAFDCFGRGLDDVHQTIVTSNFKMLARPFINKGPLNHRHAPDFGGQGYWPRNFCPGSEGRVDDHLGGPVDHPTIVSF